MHPNIQRSTIYNSQDMEATVVLNRTAKNEILPFATMWIDTENIMLSEVSQTEKDKY